MELEVAPENDDGQAEKWRGNVMVGADSHLCWPDKERTQDSQTATISLKIQRERITERLQELRRTENGIRDE